MIISVNATVCVIRTRVSDRQFMIICSGRGRRVPEGENGGVSRRKESFKVDAQSAGSCRDGAAAAGALRVRGGWNQHPFGLIMPRAGGECRSGLLVGSVG